MAGRQFFLLRIDIASKCQPFDYVELIGNMGQSPGLSKIACRFYALLFIKGKPLSLDKMAEEAIEPEVMG